MRTYLDAGTNSELIASRGRIAVAGDETRRRMTAVRGGQVRERRVG
jgi:hypothetical protein